MNVYDNMAHYLRICESYELNYAKLKTTIIKLLYGVLFKINIKIVELSTIMPCFFITLLLHHYFLIKTLPSENALPAGFPSSQYELPISIIGFIFFGSGLPSVMHSLFT